MTFIRNLFIDSYYIKVCFTKVLRGYAKNRKELVLKKNLRESLPSFASLREIFYFYFNPQS